MKYRRVSIFIIISIFLLISAQFASADGTSTLRIGMTLELNDGYSATLTSIDAEGYGSAWVKIQKDGIRTNDISIEYGKALRFDTDSGETSLTLTNVIQAANGDYLAQFYVDYPEVLGEPTEEVWDVPVEEVIQVQVEGAFEEPVEKVIEEPMEEITDKPIGEIINNLSKQAIIIGGLLIIVLFLSILFFTQNLKKSKKINNLDGEKSIKVHSNIVEEKQNISIKQMPETKPLNTIEVKSAFSYKGATILYKIKVENPTLEPIGDIKVNLYVPDVFLVSESTKSIAMLKPSESKTATFEIRPTGECGDCEVSGKVVYYDYSTKKTSEIEIPAKNLSIVCPMLHSKEISEDAWRSALSGFAKAEESTKEIDMPASTLFDITTDILQDMNLYMLEPKINDSSDLYRAVAKFYGEGVKELKYAAQIEVVGGAKKSKLILKSWAEREDALTGFYHGVLDEIEKRVHVKGYINDNIVQHVHNYGDNIGTQVKDSLVQRSNIGTGTKKCVNCGTDANLNEKFCNECGTKFE